MSETKLEYTRTWENAEDFPHLGFSRSWEDPADYPTYESNEAVVRADMQSLHDETKTYINETLIPEILAADATEKARAAAEQARADAEIARAAAEQAREAAEIRRTDTTEGIVAQATAQAATAAAKAQAAESSAAAAAQEASSAAASAAAAGSARGAAGASATAAERSAAEAAASKAAAAASSTAAADSRSAAARSAAAAGAAQSAAEAARDAAQEVAGGDFVTPTDLRAALDSEAVALKNGTPIPSGADLNTYVTPGNFKCTSPDIALTLANRPTDQTFKLVVANDALLNPTAYKSQEITDINGDVYWRYTWDNGAEKSWSGWRHRLDDSMVIAVKNGGTGAGTAEAAVKNLGAVATGESFDTKLMLHGVREIYPRITHRARTAAPTSLDDLAWEGKTYREIFEGSNAAYEDFEKSTQSWLAPAANGSNVKFWVYGTQGSWAMEAGGASGGKALRLTNTEVSSARSCQLMSRKAYRYGKGDKVYAAAMVRVDSITLGTQTAVGYHGCGLAVRNQNVTDRGVWAVKTAATGGFERCSALGTFDAQTEANLYIGCLGNYIKAACYVDKPVFLNLTNLFRQPPARSVMDALYENYIALCAGNAAAAVSVPQWQSAAPAVFSDEACVAAFVEEMNKKAAAMGMANSHFVTPSGVAAADGTTNRSTAADIAAMAAAAASYGEIGRIWRRPSATLQLGGSEKKEMELENIIPFSAYEGTQYSAAPHTCLGAKGGEWDDDVAVTTVMLSQTGEVFVHAVTARDGVSLTAAVGKLNNIAHRALAGEDVSNQTVTGAVGAVTLLLPSGAGWLAAGASPRVLYSAGGAVSHNPASCSKVLAAMVALDWCPDIRTRLVEMKPLDNVGYSGDLFLMGQTMTMETALLAVFLCSSNAVTHAVARTVGEQILRVRAALE